MNHRLPLIVLLSTFVGLLLIGALGYRILLSKGFSPRRAFPSPSAAEPPPAPITMEGELVCLPRRDGPQTLECIIGLREKDGRYYGLKGMNQQEIVTGKFMVGQQVHVTGRLTPGPMEPYDTVGSIEVHSLVHAHRGKP